MKLENTLALIHGTLINEPFINSFENIVFEAHKIKRGDLFIAFSQSDIQIAVLNGAYGIIFDRPTQISDSEIAWIKVTKLEDAVKRLLRFRLIEKDVVAYECNEIILKLALQVTTEPTFVVVFGDIKSIATSLWHVENGTTLLFCPDSCDEGIFTNVKTISSTVAKPIVIMEKTLFETSFIYDDVFYERQLISPFFIPYLEKLLHLYKSLKINFRIRKFTPIEHFEAVFTNKNFEPKEFGTSDKVLIFESNTSLIQSEIIFLQKQANWAKIIYIIPAQTKTFPHAKEYAKKENFFIYKNKKEIRDILQKSNFHFALIVGVDKSILLSPPKIYQQLTLDF
jgi:ferrochelatase